MDYKDIIIYGCGTIGKKAFIRFTTEYNMRVIAFSDSNKKLWGGGTYCGVKIIAPEKIEELHYEFIVIAMNDYNAISNVHSNLLALNIPNEKILELPTELKYMDVYMDQRIYWIKDFARQIKEQSISGSVAECGVFRGESAKFLNRFFPDRQLYLFDTFEGFEKDDLKYERKLENKDFRHSMFDSEDIFRDTDVSYVLRKMTYLNQVIIKKGYFPDSAEKIEDRFCFVNLDMDLYVPMLNGIRFFWDRLVKGGCILCHDYFHSELPGVKQAIKAFEAERKMTLPKCTIGDGCSMALLNI